MKMTFDYIVVGGGSAGCVVAGRLAENPDVSVCILEAGGGGQSSLINIPAAMVTMVATSVNNWAQRGLSFPPGAPGHADLEFCRGRGVSQNPRGSG
ncbi:GMC family oxidoreductase N-terminal domain-containing protein [Pseudomonas sp. RTC3]|uniref:lycopene cyclase family protein n=1 Tax=unclassified Pseudomonas TaxID=196821 RepID=UPI002AB4634E|nr:MULTISPECIES: lycopene cyclase family protein [unclassified Pseudomonas]MEB0060762.1 GMC family oxidoreductase N-terminal domain-containing protein [Pseudomonas sp. RTC3]MDY7564592.1 GMC family oxidoreductase N-terminal domain-containing protein [Pseudomonas sp. 5C2]MEB0009641.1 GMC family oxidoreductase N-terminal domain-containing protein [Pseudomonas sp. RTB2]MEB0016053.1 GMC family oxidoreductase N-terminal domain-containing protein [Pseudomonas sp. RTB3]MEB0240412.1 GMC family oxidored